MDKDELLWQERENMTEEEIKAIVKQEEEELERMMMGFAQENAFSKGPSMVEEEEEEEDLVKILPDGTIVSEVKEKEKQEEEGINIGDPILLLFGARLKLMAMKEIHSELMETSEEIENLIMGMKNRWVSRDMDKTFADINDKMKMIREEIRLCAGFSDDANDVVERASRRIEDKELELAVLRRVDQKVKELLSITE